MTNFVKYGDFRHALSSRSVTLNIGLNDIKTPIELSFNKIH